jgi:hypothetical protein
MILEDRKHCLTLSKKQGQIPRDPCQNKLVFVQNYLNLCAKKSQFTCPKFLIFYPKKSQFACPKILIFDPTKLICVTKIRKIATSGNVFEILIFEQENLKLHAKNQKTTASGNVPKILIFELKNLDLRTKNQKMATSGNMPNLEAILFCLKFQLFLNWTNFI